MRSLDSIIHHFDFVILIVWFYSISALPHNEMLHILECFVGTWNPKLKWIEVVFGTPPLKGFLEPVSEWTKEDLAGYFRKVPDLDFDCQDVVLEKFHGKGEPRTGFWVRRVSDSHPRLFHLKWSSVYPTCTPSPTQIFGNLHCLYSGEICEPGA